MKTPKLTIKGVTVQTEYDPMPMYGLDIEDKMITTLSEELARNIDRQILKNLGIEPDRNRRRMNSINKIISKYSE